MPIYEYQCENDHRFEAFQSMSDDALDTCPECGASARRLMRAPAVHFKGSGFYTTDYGKQKKGSVTTTGPTESSSKESGSDSKKAESKPGKSETKTESKS